MYTNKEGPSQPLPKNLQEEVWTFIRDEIQRHEHTIGAKVAKFEIHCTGSGQIEVEVLATESENDAAIDEGLEDAGLKGEVNRTTERERLAGDLE